MSGSQTFQLISRRRLIGLTHGTMRSVRRGRGTEVAGSRPYRPGDDIRSIDWGASARMSSARGADEFVVRERYADEGPRVVVVADRSAELSFFSPPLPWLDKGAAMRRATDIVVASAAQAGGFVGYLDYADGEPFWLPPRGERRLAYLREERARRRRLGRAGRRGRALARASLRASPQRHGGELRLRLLGLPRPALARDLAHSRGAPLGRHTCRDPGSGLGAELSRRQRDRRPAARPPQRPGHARAPDEEGGWPPGGARTRSGCWRCSTS